MIVYRCDVCGRDVRTFRCLKFERSVIAGGTVVTAKVDSLDVCSDACEMQAATRLLNRLSSASSVTVDTSSLSIDEEKGV